MPLTFVFLGLTSLLSLWFSTSHFFCCRTETGCWLEMKVKDGARRKTATGDDPPVSHCLTGSHGERSKESARWSKKYRHFYCLLEKYI